MHLTFPLVALAGGFLIGNGLVISLELAPVLVMIVSVYGLLALSEMWIARGEARDIAARGLRIRRA